MARSCYRNTACLYMLMTTINLRFSKKFKENHSLGTNDPIYDVDHVLLDLDPFNNMKLSNCVVKNNICYNTIQILIQQQ